MSNLNIDFKFITDILGYIYNFFATLIQALQVPFNDPFQPWSFYNPYFDTTISVGIPYEDLPTWVVKIMEFLNETSTGVFNLFLQPFGVDTSYPFWIVLLCLLPTIFGIVIIANIIYKLLPIA